MYASSPLIQSLIDKKYNMINSFQWLRLDATRASIVRDFKMLERQKARLMGMALVVSF